MEAERILERVDGAPITERDVRRGLRLNIIAGALGNVWVATALGKIGRAHV